LILSPDPKKTDVKKSNQIMSGAGIALGVGVGLAIGNAMDNIGAGLAIGLAIGAASGIGMQRKKNSEKAED
jgi:zinc transporter ZupT